jgi:hypothetical protein
LIIPLRVVSVKAADAVTDPAKVAYVKLDIVPPPAPKAIVGVNARPVTATPAGFVNVPAKLAYLKVVRPVIEKLLALISSRLAGLVGAQLVGGLMRNTSPAKEPNAPIPRAEAIV